MGWGEKEAKMCLVSAYLQAYNASESLQYFKTMVGNISLSRFYKLFFHKIELEDFIFSEL